MSKQKTVKGYKAYNKDMTCRGFQYETGKSYKTDDAIICQKGFHFCENPLDLFSYYLPLDSKFSEVEGSGKIVNHDEDSKFSCTEINIGAEINLHSLIDAGVNFIFRNVKKTKSKKANRTEEKSLASNTGNYSAASNTGDYSAASNTGDRSAASNTGYRSAASNTGNQSASSNTGNYSAASVEGKQSIACGLGIENKAKGKKTCWLVLAEWEQKNGEWAIKEVKSVLVDGIKIKEDIWYKLENGNFKEVV
jgi:hypothetical protein